MSPNSYKRSAKSGFPKALAHHEDEDVEETAAAKEYG